MRCDILALHVAMCLEATAAKKAAEEEASRLAAEAKKKAEEGTKETGGVLHRCALR